MNQKDQRQALVDTFINAIYLYDDKVLITFNYKEGTQTVTFGEATEVASEENGSDLDCFTAPKDRCTGFVRRSFFCAKSKYFPKSKAQSRTENVPFCRQKHPRERAVQIFMESILQKRRCAL